MYDNVVLDRAHRFAKGDKIFHISSPNPDDHVMTVEELTLRIREGIAFPTYTLSGTVGNKGVTETVDNILDTDDLQWYPGGK
jgi:hypothetical protein